MLKKPTYEELEQTVKELEKTFECKQAENVLFENKERYRTVLETKTRCSNSSP